MNLFVLLQAVTSNLEPTATVAPESYFSLIMKGGWVMIPIAILSILSIYYIIERWITISKAGKKDSIWQSRIIELISEGKTDRALNFCFEKPYVLGKVVAAGLKDEVEPIEDIEQSMEIEARQQISKLENHMNYLGIIASIAPMLGFLGTIFGVITIFYNISQTADLDIATISDGLYQKMICSGAGLLVGIVAYSGYYVLNGRIDKITSNLDKDSNEALRAIKSYKKNIMIDVQSSVN
ncbi:biopolymer transport protein ExbB [Dysgonomonas macrotermitis]|uniref:Biopolymer transport protein ExbB n=2 Tax=Dysgonomonas macrotermitis TaxID=1346286 RepID=A0A1M5DDE1_9BACT|nr:biopolymer transport protein ExbB [Dysgonomonas macrotermitis]